MKESPIFLPPTPDTTSVSMALGGKELLPPLGRSVAWLAGFSLAFLLGALLYSIGYGIYLAILNEGAIAPSQSRLSISQHLLSPLGISGLYLAQFLTTAPLVLLAACNTPFTWREALGFRRFPRRKAGLWLLVLAFYLLIQLLLSFTLEIDSGEFLSSIASSYSIPLAVVLVVFAPLLEEMIFRGYLFQAWRHSFLGLNGTLLLTSLLFTALHWGQYDWILLSHLFVFSVILGLARESSGSLWVPILLHASNNLIAVILIVFMGWI